MRAITAFLLITTTFIVKAPALAQDRGGPPPPPPRPLQISTTSDAIPNRYIVMVDTAANIDPVVSYVQTQLGGVVHSVWRDALFGFALEASSSAISQLAMDLRVIEIAQEGTPRSECDYTQKYPDQSCADGSIPWQLDHLDGVTDAKYYYCYAGSGVKIYMVDTGIQAGHAEFSGRVVDGVSFVSGEPSTVDADGHGTIAASAAAGKKAGAAKKAVIIPVRVGRTAGEASLQKYIDAANWIVKDIRCVAPDRSTPGCVGNLNWMLPVVYFSITSSRSTAFETAVRSLVNAGAAVVAPAGNSGGNACSNGLANVSGVMIVGALQRSGSSLSVWSGSASGGCVTMLAPGVTVGTGYLGGYNCNPGWTGTSWSSASAAGVAGVFLERFRGDARMRMLQYATYGAIQGDLRGSPNVLLRSIADCVFAPETCGPYPPYSDQ